MGAVRKSMTDARKRRIWEAADGLCYHCHEPVPMLGPDVRYDHVIGVWFTERDEDEDVLPAHTTCDAPKTANDTTRRAKTKRQMRMRVGAERPESRLRSNPKIRSRPFPKGHRKLQSRGFR